MPGSGSSPEKREQVHFSWECDLPSTTGGKWLILFLRWVKIRLLCIWNIRCVWVGEKIYSYEYRILQTTCSGEEHSWIMPKLVSPPMIAPVDIRVSCRKCGHTANITLPVKAKRNTHKLICRHCKAKGRDVLIEYLHVPGPGWLFGDFSRVSVAGYTDRQ